MCFKLINFVRTVEGIQICSSNLILINDGYCVPIASPINGHCTPSEDIKTISFKFFCIEINVTNPSLSSSHKFTTILLISTHISAKSKNKWDNLYVEHSNSTN